jgi:allantoicase
MSKYSKYAGVSRWVRKGDLKKTKPWCASHIHKTKGRWMKSCETEREAAKAYDIRLIELGLEPVNILKRKL